MKFKEEPRWFLFKGGAHQPGAHSCFTAVRFTTRSGGQCEVPGCAVDRRFVTTLKVFPRLFRTSPRACPRTLLSRTRSRRRRSVPVPGSLFLFATFSPIMSDPSSNEEPSVPEGQPMLSARRANRMAAMQFVYMTELNPPENLLYELRRFFESQEQPREYYAFAEELIHGVFEHRAVIDREITGCLEHWSFQRIARIDLAILRVALFELLYRPDIPPVVTINEAIELSKMFSIEEARRFINGILDKISARLGRPMRTAE